MLLEVLAAKAELQVPVSDEGSFRADLRAFLVASFAMGRQPQLIDVLRALMARAQIDEAFGERFRAAFLQRRRDALAVILDRALDRGDLPPAASPGTITDLVFGIFWYRMLATREPYDERLADELVSVLAGLSRRRPGNGGRNPRATARPAPWAGWAVPRARARPPGGGHGKSAAAGTARPRSRRRAR